MPIGDRTCRALAAGIEHDHAIAEALRGHAEHPAELAAAYERGFFKDLVVPFRGLERDNILRGDTTLEKPTPFGRAQSSIAVQTARAMTLPAAPGPSRTARR